MKKLLLAAGVAAMMTAAGTATANPALDPTAVSGFHPDPAVVFARTADLDPARLDDPDPQELPEVIWTREEEGRKATLFLYGGNFTLIHRRNP